VGGNAEAVKDGITGFLVPSEDPDALSAAILRLLSDPSLAKAMGAAGRKVVAERFTTEAMMNQIAGAYRNLLSSR
jgi:glycosyltransferase involved in cell wall biosynthesis